jgi:O-antigen/teichoic acid export membrane protein
VTVVYGERFEPAGSTLQWLAGVCVVAWLSGHYRFGLIAAGQQTAEMMTAAAGAVVAAILIPVGYKENGPEGAAMALVAAEIVIWAGSWWFSRRRLGIDHHARLLVRPLVAVAVTIGLLWPLSTYSCASRAVAALGAFTALAFLLDPAVRNHLRQARAARRAGQLLSKELPEVTR